MSRIGLVLCSLLLTLTAAELILRTVEEGTRAAGRRGLHEARPDRPWIYGMRPGAETTLEVSGDVLYRVNSDGFRDERYARPKPEAAFRVLVLGDSVAFGYGVEQTESFPKRMEKELNSLAGEPPVSRIEILNLGVSGYNPYTQRALLEDIAASYQPDLVLVQFCINDLNDPTLHFDVQTRLHLGAIPDAAYPDPSARRTVAQPPGRLLRACRKSRVCSLLDNALLALFAEIPDDEQNRAAAVPIEPDAGPEWRWLEEQYRAMAQTSRALGAEFALLAFPYPAQLEDDEESSVTRRLVALGERNGWLTVDPLPRFRAAHRAGVPLFIDWWHPTPAGHRLAAQETLRSLTCAGLLPEFAEPLCD